MSIFLTIFPTKCSSELKKSSPGASMRIYEYVPYQMFLKSLRKVDQELQGAYISIFLTKGLLKA